MNLMPGLDPALVIAPKKNPSALAIHFQSLGNALLQASHRHDDLEHRARGNLGLDRLVQQRVRGIGRQTVPLVAGNAHCEVVGVKRRAAHHGQDLAIARVHGYNSAVFPLQSHFRRLLDIKINRKLQLLAGDGGYIGILGPSYLFAFTVHQHLARAVFAHENVVVLKFDAGLTHDVSALIGFELRRVQHILAYFADVTDQVRHETVLGIQAAVNGKSFQLGKLILMGLEEGAFVRRDVVLDGDGLERREMGKLRPAYFVQHVGGGKVQAFGDLLCVAVQVARLIAQQEHGKRWIVVDDDLAFAIQDFAARRQQRNQLDTILVRLYQQFIAAAHLQAPQAIGEKNKHSQNSVLDGGELNLRDFCFATEHTCCTKEEPTNGCSSAY